MSGIKQTRRLSARGTDLTAAGILVLAGMVLVRGMSGPAETLAAPPRERDRSAADEGNEMPGIPNAAAQRKAMIASLESIDARLRAIEAKLSTPLTVKVVEMPAVELAGE